MRERVIKSWICSLQLYSYRQCCSIKDRDKSKTERQSFSLLLWAERAATSPLLNSATVCLQVVPVTKMYTLQTWVWLMISSTKPQENAGQKSPKSFHQEWKVEAKQLEFRLQLHFLFPTNKRLNNGHVSKLYMSMIWMHWTFNYRRWELIQDIVNHSHPRWLYDFMF